MDYLFLISFDSTIDISLIISLIGSIIYFATQMANTKNEISNNKNSIKSNREDINKKVNKAEFEIIVGNINETLKEIKDSLHRIENR